MLAQHGIDEHHEHHMLMPAYPAIVNADGSNTGPSMRTMQGASLSAAPPQGKSGFGTVIVLGFVGVLGVVAGVVVARQPGRVAADTPAAPVTYVAATVTTPTPSAPTVLPLLAPAPSGSSVRPVGHGTVVPGGGVSKSPPPPPPPPSTAGDGTKPVKPIKPKKPKGDGDEYGF